MIRLGWMLLPLALAACMPEDQPTGAEDFATYCAACHGSSGKGDGPGAAGLDQRPVDLTQLSARDGGEFPGTRVMAKIWGYTGRDSASAMPQFGPLLQGELVPYDGGDGIATPTPVRLVQLAEYVRLLQGK
ncbi:c-type cytochrome [Tabrizicola sp.]|uniref:c-type cytochrome n=1 Tax=Tabrizicola sp. TaxID=2005166 RepID=UPI0026080572|nr:c-type cytochrome [Tabrizicola sp.]MDM7932123.1 c-type cytochrome [Tabrizicola sp.]